MLNFHFINNIKGQLYKHDSFQNVVYIDNLPMVDYGYKYNQYVGLQFCPYAIANSGIKILRDNEGNLTENQMLIIHTIANWLINNKINISSNEWENDSNILSFTIWLYNFSYPSSDKKNSISAPFHSALAQGFIIEFFQRMFLYTNNQTYLDQVYFAFNAFKVTIENSGLLLIEDDGYLWLPEVVEFLDLSKKRYILNGCLGAMRSIIVASELSNSSQFKIQVDFIESKLMQNLNQKISFYDYKSVWSYYDRLKHLASKHYHAVHIKLLEYFVHRTNSTILHEYLNTWKNTSYNDFPKDFNWYINSFYMESIIWIKYTFPFSLIFSTMIIIILIIGWRYKKKKMQ